MATSKTPPHKRISRAEKSAADWKQKAIERREENEALKARLFRQEERCSRLSNESTQQQEEKKVLQSIIDENEASIKQLESANSDLKKKLQI
jgi:chromosome segregation ATPase